ncbi:MAG: hypothetical protein AAF502_06360 [Bacteroidota bacterium]
MILIAVALLAFAYGYYGFKTNKDLFTQKLIYDEMAGMIPLFIMVGSGVVALIAVLIKFFSK